MTAKRTGRTILVAALEMLFGTAIQKELNRVKLRSRRRQRGEPLVEMADDIERLARLAYDDAPTAMQDTHAKKQFIDAMTDDDQRVRVLQSRPTSLRSALELESFTLAVRRTPTVRTVSDAHDNAKSENDLPKLIGDMFDRFSTNMTQLVYGGRWQRPPARTNRWVQPRGNCWNCGDMATSITRVGLRTITTTSEKRPRQTQTASVTNRQESLDRARPNSVRKASRNNRWRETVGSRLQGQKVGCRQQ